MNHRGVMFGITALIFLALNGAAWAQGAHRDVEAGPIWNQADAQGKCNAVQRSARWTGHWWTTVQGKMSVCQCAIGAVQAKSVVIEAGPIWNQKDATGKCPRVCAARWNGHWKTTVQGRMSVCGIVWAGREAPAKKPAPKPIQRAARNHDGCSAGGQMCVCGNTQWAGACGTGPHKSGLYCRCDKRVAHHDGCVQRAQACRCGNTGWKGTCNTGPHKAGLYCRCD